MELQQPKARPSPRRLNDEQRDLAEAHLPMARALARPFKQQFPDYWEEFESAASLALVQAAERFSNSRDVKFTTFARRRILGALRDTRRQRLNHGRRPGSDLLPKTYSLSGATPENRGRVMLVADEDPVGSELEAIEAVEALLRKLPRLHAQACRWIYLHGKTHVETAQLMEVCPSRITYLHIESLSMLGGTWHGQTRRPQPLPNPHRKGRRPRSGPRSADATTKPERQTPRPRSGSPKSTDAARHVEAVVRSLRAR